MFNSSISEEEQKMATKVNRLLVDVRYKGVRLFIANSKGYAHYSNLEEYIDTMLISDYPECDRAHVFYGALTDCKVEEDLQALRDKNNLFPEYAV